MQERKPLSGCRQPVMQHPLTYVLLVWGLMFLILSIILQLPD